MRARPRVGSEVVVAALPLPWGLRSARMHRSLSFPVHNCNCKLTKLKCAERLMPTIVPQRYDCQYSQSQSTAHRTLPRLGSPSTFTAGP